MFREIGVSIADYREKLQHTPYRTTCPSSCALDKNLARREDA